MTYYINIGTNLGDRQANIAAAVSALEHLIGAKALCSDAVTSPPWGYQSNNEFLNIAVAIVCDIAPAHMLALLKRIVALPGETVDIAQGRVYIDGRPLEESAYAVNFEQGGDMAATVVPEGKVFVLSDNRAESYDSRSPQIGCVTYEKIEGVLRFRILPTSRIAFYY